MKTQNNPYMNKYEKAALLSIDEFNNLHEMKYVDLTALRLESHTQDGCQERRYMNACALDLLEEVMRVNKKLIECSNDMIGDKSGEHEERFAKLCNLQKIYKLELIELITKL